jgi:hypothetical protein
MAIINKGKSFANGEQLTADKLNQVIDNATFTISAVDNVSTQLSGGAIIVKDGGVTTAKLNDGAVTKAKIENVANMKVLGNTSGSAAAPQEVSILDEDDMSSDSATALSTQQSIKAYVDARAADPARGYNNLSHDTASETIIENTTGRPLFVSFTLFSSDDIGYLLLEISPNSNMTGGTRIAQFRMASDGAANSGGQVCGIVPDGWYWKVGYSGSTLSEKVHCSFAL